MLCRVNLATEYVNPVAPQFVNHEISAVYVLNKSSGICSPTNIIRRSPDFLHWRAADHTLGQKAAVGDAVGNK